MEFWDKVKKDVQKGFREGLAAIRERAEELTDEGRKKYKLFDLKNKVQKEMSELGGAVYEVRKETRNPMNHERVKAIVAKIARLQEQIERLEGKPARAGRKKAAPKKKAAKKKSAKKTTAKKTARKAAKKTPSETSTPSGTGTPS